jgi:methylaspartate ammonia-lyase
MQIVDVIASRGVGSSSCTAQRAHRHAARIDGLFIEAEPVLPGFRAPREVPEAIRLQLLLDDGAVANGDGSSGVFPGRAGVDPPVRADEQIRIVEQTIKPLLIGRSLDTFRPLAEEIDPSRLTVSGCTWPSAGRSARPCSTPWRWPAG